MIKLVLSDLDGTLIQIAPKIQESDRAAIQQLKKTDIQFGLVTGRDIGFCQHLLDLHALHADCVIANNGGSLWIQNEKVLEHHMDAAEVIQIMEQLTPFVGRCHPFICSEEREFFLMKKAYHDNASWQAIRRRLAYLGNLSETDLLEQLKQNEMPVVKISIFTCDAQTTKELLPLFKQLFTAYEVLPTADDYIELTRKGIHKGKTLQTLMDSMHLNEKEVCVIGDGHNDIPMFQCVSQSFVMESASDEVKEHGTRIVKSVAEAVHSVIQYNQIEQR